MKKDKLAPAIEYELDEAGNRTGRVRAKQFMRTLRRQAIPPSKRGDMPFEFPRDTLDGAGTKTGS